MTSNAGKGMAGSMTPEQYMTERVDDQLIWYGKKSATNKNWHHRLQLLTLVAAASIPVISLSSAEFVSVRVVVAIIGSITAIAAGIVTLYQFKDLWVDYRATAEQLKYEKYLYLTGSAPYDKGEAFSMFVNQVENIIIQENRGWHEKLNSQPVDPNKTSEQANPS